VGVRLNRPGQPFGVEIDLDLREPLTIAEQEAIRDLLFTTGAIVARDQHLSMEDHVRVGRYFGPVLESEGDGIGYISNVKGKGNLGNLELAYHCDLAFTPYPSIMTSLHAVEVEDGRSSTRLASGMRAYALLPAELKSRLEGLAATCAWPPDQTARSIGSKKKIPHWAPRVVRPVVIGHPVTGVPLLTVTEQQSVRVEGMAEEESDALLKELFAYLYRADNVYEHRWYNGDLLIWDNIAVQHARGHLAGAGRRTLQRVGAGEKSLYEMCPQFSRERFADPDSGAAHGQKPY
jgi:alpha-ketoglutarate-dependent taurine dioxygenase